MLVFLLFSSLNSTKELVPVKPKINSLRVTLNLTPVQLPLSICQTWGDSRASRTSFDGLQVARRTGCQHKQTWGRVVGVGRGGGGGVDHILFEPLDPDPWTVQLKRAKYASQSLYACG